LIEDWDKFIYLAYAHGVFPLVYDTLKEFQDQIPMHVFQKLKITNMNIVKQNMLMTSELIKVMKLLEENHINAISFKGPVLSQMAYGDITLRQYVDLDILIDEKDLKKSMSIFLENNYINSIPLKLLERELFLEVSKDFTIINKTNGINVELHWNMFDRTYDFSENKLSKKELNYVKLNTTEVQTFSNELYLVYLCMHGSKHMWERIEWIKDIDLLLRNQIVDLSKISTNFWNNYSFTLGLHLSQVLFDTPIDSIYERYTNSKKIESITKKILSSYQTHEHNESFKFYTKLFFYHLTLLDTKGKFEFINNKLFKVTIIDLETYPNIKSKYLFLFLKPYRLISKYLFPKNKKFNTKK